MVRFTAAVSLPFRNNDFGFSFVMPDFYKPERIQYYYRLRPYQKEWQTGGSSREAHFTNMSPGAYTFEVKAKTASGRWSDGEASIRVVILPPWYRTWWAYLLWAGLLTGIVGLFYRQHLKQVMARSENRRLHDLNHLKARLYTNITHEFRTPLTVILGLADSIRGHSKEKELILRNSQNLLRLINQLLDLSKLDSGALRLNKVRNDIIGYLHYLTESFHSLTAGNQVKLLFKSSIEEWVMDFDEEKIQQLIYNLLSNAIRFTPEGGRVELQVDRGRQEGDDWLQITVSDTGPGIAPEHLPHIFDRFYQVEDAHPAGAASGTGIGLAWVREIVELMGGEVRVESTPGAGTTFRVWLPAPQGTETVPENGWKEAAWETPSQPSAAEPLVLPISDEPKPTLLIIEDNRDVLTYIRSLLEDRYTIRVAYDGQTGMEQALEWIPDIIISDVMMPEKKVMKYVPF